MARYMMMHRVLSYRDPVGNTGHMVVKFQVSSRQNDDSRDLKSQLNTLLRIGL